MILGLVCTPNPCTNGGTCEPRPNGVFHCLCTHEYEGQRCEFRRCPLRGMEVDMHYLNGSFPILGKVCEPNPCRNGGTCSPYGLDTYSCNCPFGYTGRNCETRKCNEICFFQSSVYPYIGDACIPNPCQNGGRCRSDVATGSYVCDCPANFLGQNCETSKSLF